MSRGIYVALSGAIAQENALESTASNLANASSPGYQRLRPVFREALAAASNKDPSLRYATIERTSLDTTAGTLRSTGRGLDVALPSGAYLAVSGANGERFTRGASLAIDKSGVLRTSSGSTVRSPEGRPINVSPTGGEVRVGEDGTVQQGASVVGRLKVVRFERPDRLVPEGAGLLAVGEAGAMTPSKEPLTVGAVEDSNAQPVNSMTELMSASRTFEAFQRVLETLGEIDRKLLTSVPGAFEQ